MATTINTDSRRTSRPETVTTTSIRLKFWVELVQMASCIGIPIAALLTTRRLADIDWNLVEHHCPPINRSVKRHRSSDEVRRELEWALCSQFPCSIGQLTSAVLERSILFCQPGDHLYAADI
jgi:hypothetical protein